MQETEDLLMELLERMTIAVETIADAVASHVEIFESANDE